VRLCPKNYEADPDHQQPQHRQRDESAARSEPSLGIVCSHLVVIIPRMPIGRDDVGALVLLGVTR
jgi:hypothetical protein